LLTAKLCLQSEVRHQGTEHKKNQKVFLREFKTVFPLKYKINVKPLKHSIKAFLFELSNCQCLKTTRVNKRFY